MEPIELQAFLDLLEEVEDPRVNRTRRHKLTDILLLVLIGTLCDQRGWDAIYQFSAFREAELKTLLELPHGIPSPDTLRRVFRALDPGGLKRVLVRWARMLHGATEGSHVAIDGKTVRGAFAEDGSALHLVSAWASETKLILAQYAADAKSNEITAIPQLLELLKLRGSTVTIDAMGCQKAIAQNIIDKKADYVFGLKGNHPTLHQEVLSAFDDDTCNQLRAHAKDFHEEADKGHGRL